MDPWHSLRLLQDYIERERFAGYDPYDALNSPLVRVASLGQKFPRIAAIQLLKRLPLNLRPLLGIRKGYNPKGLGLFLWGYAKLYGLEKKPEHAQKIDTILDLLDQTRNRDYPGNGWGYNFDWQSRAFFIPKFTPTVVNSAFIGHALLDTAVLTGRGRAVDMALPIGEFILRGLNRQEENDSICFSYTPLDQYYVHNANLLGASLLIRLSQETGNKGFKDAALSSLGYSVKRQCSDGSWFYAEREGSHWIDSFHTGFDLQSIKYFLDAGYGEEYRPAFEKGVRYYAENFFLEDGTPKYYNNAVYPIDIHSPAQAVVFFSRIGEPYKGLATQALSWMIRNMQDEDGHFFFQKHRLFTNRIPYMRWGQAWAFHALTEYINAQQ
ncbi:MAG: hypothetical protein PHY31_01960 [Smithellaceae bacterium]|nr:hypothetical protein [Smithellaceae bacterium]